MNIEESIKLLYKEAIKNSENVNELITARNELTSKLFEIEVYKKFIKETINKELFASWLDKNTNLVYAKTELLKEIYGVNLYEESIKK